MRGHKEILEKGNNGVIAPAPVSMTALFLPWMFELLSGAAILDFMFVTLSSLYRRLFVIAAVLVVLAALTGVIIWQKYFRSPSDASDTPPSPIVTTPSATPPPPSASGGAPLQQAPAYTGSPVQNLLADAEVLKQIPADTYEKSRRELTELAVKLASNPRSTDDWMRVAFIKRFYHDYLGARDAYEYLNRIDESNALPFYNLGGLYGYYLKEPSQAILKYEAAIARDPTNASYYTGWADFYREVAGDLAAAERVLKQGLNRVPDDANILIGLAVVAERRGDLNQAIGYYERVLAGLNSSGSQRAAIEAEIERLGTAKAK